METEKVEVVEMTDEEMNLVGGGNESQMPHIFNE